MNTKFNIVLLTKENYKEWKVNRIYLMGRQTNGVKRAFKTYGPI